MTRPTPAEIEEVIAWARWYENPVGPPPSPRGYLNDERLARALLAVVAERDEARETTRIALRHWIRESRNRLYGAAEAQDRARCNRVVGTDAVVAIVHDLGIDLPPSNGGRHG